MKAIQVITLLAFAASCSARMCQDGSLGFPGCTRRSALHSCIDFCEEANPDICNVPGTGCLVKATCETPAGGSVPYACCECGCRQGDNSCERK
ncbi:hypothetical protein BKA57DRAFT_461448 [Linnemannia elongata]|nr:hypothetical protein BKA57DRAFT_461448 [Linnemannia elongata]KAK5798847.1 hypothetical protein F5H01DRAFT_358443 [Linnemannia elongata]